MGEESVPLREHFEALRDADQRALAIKEKADEQALDLAREIQTYKDEKANELREQISSERGLYATKDDLVFLGDKFETAMKPALDWVAGRRGRDAQGLDTRTLLFSILIFLVGVGTIISPHIH